MTLEEIIKIATAVLLSLGGGSAIVFAFSSWLGKVWANRIMDKERAKFERELAELRAKLEQTNQEGLSKLRTDLEIYRDRYLKEHGDKIAIYRLVIDVVSGFLADIEELRSGHRVEGNVIDRFNRGRLKAHGYLAMLAPQQVMNAYDSLIDHLFSIYEKPLVAANAYEEWKEVRRLSYLLINAVREDIGIDKSKIEYRGNR